MTSAPTPPCPGDWRDPLFLAVLALLMALPTRAAAQIAAPVDIRIPVAPSPVMGDGMVHLAYELHLTNYAPVPVTVTRVRALAGRAVVMDYAAEELRGNTRWIGVQGEGPGGEHVEIGAGGQGVLFAWVTVAPDAVPDALHHTLALQWTSSEGDGRETELTVGPEALGPPPAVISPPLRGDNFFAANGPANDTGHRRALIPVSGKARIAQRFATDWVQLVDGGTNVGDPEANSTYHIWGAEALAVADGTVAAVKDSIPENVPGVDSRAVPITLETVGGNFVILDIGGRNFAFYAHLQPGSIRVSAGDRVVRGQVIGLVGNSGNSTEPHLHFHVANGQEPLGAEGVPFVFDRFTVTGRTTGFGTPVEPVSPEVRENETPLANVVVRFDERR